MPKFKVDPSDLIEAGEDFRKLDRKMHAELDEEIDELKFLALSELEEAAPVGHTGILKRGIKARKTKNGFDLRINAVDPESGFDYAAVTRFGHRLDYINSTRDLIMDRRGRIVTAKMKINFVRPRGQNPYFKDFVRGVGHTGAGMRDWAFDAIFLTEQFAQRSAKSLSARLDIRVFTGGMR